MRRNASAAALALFAAVLGAGAASGLSTTTVGLLALLCAVAALLLLTLERVGFHAVRTRSGTAFVYTVRDGAGEPVRVLSQGGVYQSATYLGERRFEPVFAYQRAFDRMFEPGMPVRRVLMVGGGGYAYPKHAMLSRPEVEMTVVELDAAVTDAARRFFFLDELLARPGVAERLHLVEGDGRTYMERAAEGGEPAFDVIVNDAFSGSEPVRALATVEAAQAARATLRAGGLYLANVVSRERGSDLSFLRDEVATLACAFAHVNVIPVSDEEFGGEDNYLLVATDSPHAFEGAVPYDEAFPGSVLRD